MIVRYVAFHHTILCLMKNIIVLVLFLSLLLFCFASQILPYLMLLLNQILNVHNLILQMSKTEYQFYSVGKWHIFKCHI